LTFAALRFAEPTFLLVLLLVPLALLARMAAERRARRHAVRFPGVGVLAGVAGGGGLPWRRLLPPAFFLAALAALAFALARPERTIAVPVERASIVLILDTSRSMLADDVAPDRFTAAREAADAFIDRLPSPVRVGIVGFSDSPYTVVRPTTDRTAVKNTLDGLAPNGGTATGPAIKAAVDALPPEKGRRPPSAIILLSDGKATVGGDPIPEAKRAGRARIPITTVALGSPDGVVQGPFGQPLAVPPDPETLRRIAEVSGGHTYRVDDADRLQDVYRALGSRLGTRKRQHEVTSAFAGGALVLLLAAVATGVRWRVRLP
jgi:Ca-activated chloride channel family protein